MATGFMTAIAKRSRTVEDFWCKSCTEQNLQESANIYCETCVQFYCKKCAIHHSEMSSKHTTHGRGDIKKWPVSTKVVDFLRKCELHDDKTLQQFCDDHSQLCCSDCFLSLHSQCNKVTPISELTSTMSTDLQGLSTKLETILEEIESLQKCQEAAMQSLDTSFTENEGFVMQDLSLNINTSIGARDDSTEKDLKEMKDEVISIKCSISSYIHKCIGLQNELSQLYESIQKIGDNKELCLIASIKCELALHHSFTVLGKSGKMFTVQGKTVHNVRIPNDSLKCYIVDCCVLSDGQVLLADQDNKKVKLLNQQYQVVSHCRVTQKPQGICQITPSEGAVAVNNEVQFITVNQGQLFLGRKLQLRHICTGIAHHQGDLFICSHNTLFKYSLSGKKICRLYEDISEGITVRSCAVSPTGDKLYITNWSHDKLLTLARDGTVLAIYTDPELIQPRGVHVTPAGQVLVCGWASNTIIQVECEGTRKLATLVTRDRDGVKSPMSVCYSSTTSSILVGQFKDENIMVFKVEPNKETSSKHVSTQGDFRRLFDQLNIDVMAECGSALFPAFRHGCGALQGIVTRGKCIFDDPVFNETESEIVFQRCIQLYTTSILMDNIKASYTKPMQLSHVKIFSRQKQNISFPALVAVDKERYVKIKNWISSLNKEINGLCVLLVNEATDTTYIAPEWGVFQSMTTISDTFVTADDLLERAIFAVLKNLVEKCINKYGSSTDLSDIEQESTLQSIYNYARTAYKRSEVPTPEIPALPEISYSYPTHMDEVIKGLLETEGVVGCSKNIGQLEVIIENTEEKNATINRVNLYLQNKNVKAIFIHGKLTPLVSSGDKVSNERVTRHFATLGGFALKFPETTTNSYCSLATTSIQSSTLPQNTNGKLVALISRHLAPAFGCESVYACNNIGSLNIGKINNIHDDPLVDIIPVDINEDVINQCDSRFKTEIGVQMYGKLRSTEEPIFAGDQVYIWGASTPLGLGTIASVDLNTRNGLLITIHDRNEGESFCKEGDSGAMVCATDNRERTLYALAMIQGKIEKSSGRATYVAVSLNEAFKLLEKYYFSKFSLCNDHASPHE